MTTIKDLLRDYGMAVAEVVQKASQDEEPTIEHIVDVELEAVIFELKKVLGFYE